MLYWMLKTPCFSRAPLLKRAALIKAFQEDDDFREKLQLSLIPLEERSEKDSTELLWGQLPPRSSLVPLYNRAGAFALLSLFSPLLLGAQGVLIIMSLFSLNIYLHHRVSKRIAHLLPAISSLAALLRAALQITALERLEIRDKVKEIRKVSGVCRAILKKTKFLHPNMFLSDLDLVYEYLKYFFLLEVRAFYASLDALSRHAKQLRAVYLAIGELDALQAIASYRESAPDYVEPELSEGGAAFYKVKDVRHPLLADAVPNSITINSQGMLVTGSNMAGKSTFLRTLGINALFAQTIYTCPASSYRGSFFRVISSISREDNLVGGKSFYYQEAERLLKLIRAASEKVETPAFCLIDELLSGTNYTERLAASEAILNHLARQNSLVIVATHDLDLAEKLQGLYRCIHFSDQVGRDGLHFDFKLKEGIASTRNAIKLLAYLGYPRAIIEQASRLAGGERRRELNTKDKEV